MVSNLLQEAKHTACLQAGHLQRYKVRCPGTFTRSLYLDKLLFHLLLHCLVGAYIPVFREQVGNNIEDVLGRFWFIVFYFACGFAASAAQVFATWGSNIPGIGASGAIAGVLAAYLLFYPAARVDTLIFLGLFARIAALPAVLVLGMWFVLQLFNGVLSFGMTETGGTAWFAHIGGFVAGLILCLPWISKARRRRSYRW